MIRLVRLDWQRRFDSGVSIPAVSDFKGVERPAHVSTFLRASSSALTSNEVRCY